MPLAHKTTPAPGLPDALVSQISNNFRKEEDFDRPVVSVAKEEEAAPASRSKYADTVNLRLSSGKRHEFKKFFTNREMTMNQGIEMAVDYIIREVKAGRLSISKSGITVVEE